MKTLNNIVWVTGSVLIICLAILMVNLNKIKNREREFESAHQFYSRPPWIYSGATNVVHKPLRRSVLKDQPNLDLSKVALPDQCRVTVPPGVATNSLLGDVYITISNSIEIANQILKDKNYSIHYFSRSTTLVSEDVKRNGVWYIGPSNQYGSISVIQFRRYEDEDLTMLNVSESFDVSFKMDGSLDTFRTMDSAAALRCEHMTWDVHPFDISWIRRISPHHTKELRFDVEGKLVGEKVQDSRNFPSPF